MFHFTFEQIMFYELELPAIQKYKKSEGFIDADVCPMPIGRLQRLVWSTFEYPETSRVAFVVSVVSARLLRVIEADLNVACLCACHG